EQAREHAPKLSYDDLPTPEFVGVRVLSSAVAGSASAPPALVSASLAGPESEAAQRGASQNVRGGRGPGFFSLSDLVPFIDWSPFFHTWELRGRYPAILNHPRHGEEARKLFADAQELLANITDAKLLTARGVYGLFPANRTGDDVELYTDGSR